MPDTERQRDECNLIVYLLSVANAFNTLTRYFILLALVPVEKLRFSLNLSCSWDIYNLAWDELLFFNLSNCVYLWVCVSVHFAEQWETI